MRMLSPSKMHPVYPGPVVQEAQVVNFAAHVLRHRIKHLHASGIKNKHIPQKYVSILEMEEQSTVELYASEVQVPCWKQRRYEL